MSENTDSDTGISGFGCGLRSPIQADGYRYYVNQHGQHSRFDRDGSREDGEASASRWWPSHFGLKERDLVGLPSEAKMSVRPCDETGFAVPGEPWPDQTPENTTRPPADSSPAAADAVATTPPASDAGQREPAGASAPGLVGGELVLTDCDSDQRLREQLFLAATKPFFAVDGISDQSDDDLGLFVGMPRPCQPSTPMEEARWRIALDVAWRLAWVDEAMKRLRPAPKG